jgi:tyrosine-protein kinase Etk/Wzc
MQLPSVIANRDNDQDSIDLLGIFGSLIDQKWLIGAFTGAFMAAGVAYAVLATPVYLANALVQVEPKKRHARLFRPQQHARWAIAVGDRNRHHQIPRGDRQNRRRPASGHRRHPNTFPVIGGFLARRYRGETESSVAPPRFGFNSYAWGGERLEFARLDLPKELLGKKLTLIAGEQQHFQLLDDNDNLLIEGVAGEAFAQDGVEGLIERLQANPGARFEVVRNPRIVTIQGYQDALDISEQGKESGIIRLALASADAAEAVKILNKIAALYVDQNVRRTSAEAAQSLAFLQSQLPQVKRDLAKASDALNAYQTHGKTVNISLETQSVLGQSVALETRISELKCSRRKWIASSPNSIRRIAP